MGFFNLFGGDIMDSITKIATEFIDTPEEKEKARSLMVKTLDPNGLMRRQISSTVSKLYVVYMLIVMVLVLMQSFGIGDATGVEKAINNLTDLFVPITTSFTAIVGASFGVNGINSYKDK